MSTGQTTDTKYQFNIYDIEVRIKPSFQLCLFTSNFRDKSFTDKFKILDHETFMSSEAYCTIK